MGDRIAVMNRGVLQQIGTPEELYTNPRNAFVAGFIGSPAMNLFRLPLSSGGARFGALDVPLPRGTLRAAAAGGAEEIVLGVRPEQFEFLSPEDRETPGLDLVVERVEDTGAAVHLHTTAWSGEGLARIVVRLPGRPAYGAGATLRVTVRRDGVHCFSALTGQRLPVDADSSPAT